MNYMHYEKQIHKAQTNYINNWFKTFKHSPYGKDYISGKIDLEDLNNMLINEFLPLKVVNTMIKLISNSKFAKMHEESENTPERIAKAAIKNARIDNATKRLIRFEELLLYLNSLNPEDVIKLCFNQGVVEGCKYLGPASLNWQACYVRNCEDDRVPHIANMIVKHEFGPKNLVLQNEPRCYE